MKSYFLPEKNRAKLQEAWGTPLYGNVAQVGSQYSKYLKEKKYRRVITVGDFCSLHLTSDIKIFDRKVQRQVFEHDFTCAKEIKNAPGTIQKEAWPAMKNALAKKTNVCVDGEEDLLVLPAVLQSGNNNLVVYGLPNKGVCLIETTQATKKLFSAFLKENFSVQKNS